MWYVIQVKTGREEIVRQWLSALADHRLYEDCRIIDYETKKKRSGRWQIERKKAFPGYLFLITEQIEAMRQQLQRIPEFTKVLGTDGEIVPLSQEEERFLQQLAGDGQCVEMSYGIQAGDQVMIESGPLRGMESFVRKINRHKRTAIVEITMFMEKREITLGLEILKKI